MIKKLFFLFLIFFICLFFVNISFADLQKNLKSLSQYNAVHLEGAEQPDPMDPEKSYLEASSLYRSWLEHNVLQQDEKPNYYLMSYGYEFDGNHKQQLALFGGIAVENYDKKCFKVNTSEPRPQFTASYK